MTPVGDSGMEMGQFQYPQAQSEDWSILSKVAMASISSQGTMGGLLVAGFVSSYSEIILIICY
jgi:hypothetical protein